MYQKQYECIHLANPFSDKWGRWTKRRRADFDMLLKKVGEGGNISDKTKERVNGRACGQFLGVG